MGKGIGQIYKHIQYQISIFSLKAPVSSSSEPQTSSAIKLTTTSVTSITNKHQNNYVLYYQNNIQNYATITNNDDIQSCETPEKQNFNTSTISTPNHHSQRIASTLSSRLNSNTPMILSPADEEYMCIQKDGKTEHAVRCIKSRIMTKVINSDL